MVTFYLTAKDGFKIACRRYDAISAPVRGVVQIVPGAKESQSKYVDLARFLNAEGFHVITSDTRGHGDSVSPEYPLGYMDDWHVLTEDQAAVAEYASGRYCCARETLRATSDEDVDFTALRENIDWQGNGETSLCGEQGFRGDLDDCSGQTLRGAHTECGENRLPLFILAHSFGTVLARALLRRHDALFSGMVLSAPVRYIPSTVFAVPLGRMIAFPTGGRGYSGLLLRFGDPGGSEYGYRFRNDAILTDWAAIRDLPRARNHPASNPDLPILFVSGAEDRVTGGSRGLQRSMGYLQSAGYRRIRNIVYPAFGHSLIHAAGRETVWRDIAAFLRANPSAGV